MASTQEIQTPQQIVIPSFALRAAEGIKEVVFHAGWSLEEYAREIERIGVDDVGMMWEGMRPSISRAQSQIDSGQIPAGIKKYLVAGTEVSRSESTVGAVFHGARWPLNLVYAGLQDHRFSEASTSQAMGASSLFGQLHPERVIPYRVYHAENGQGLITESRVPNKVLTFELARVVGAIPHPKDADPSALLGSIISTASEYDVIGIDLNPRDLLSTLDEGQAFVLMELLLREQSLVQTVTVQSGREFDLKGTVASEQWERALDLVATHFLGTVIVSPGENTLRRTVPWVANRLRN